MRAWAGLWAGAEVFCSVRAECPGSMPGFSGGFQEYRWVFLVENRSQLSSAAECQCEKDSVSSPGVSLTQACRSGLWPDLKASGVRGQRPRQGRQSRHCNAKNPENP